MKPVLIVETNVQRYGDTQDPTGLWLGEAAEFVADMTVAGIAVDYVSPNGGYVSLDPRSMKYTNAEIMQVYAEADFQERALAHTLRPAEVNAADYAAIYFTGGHGVMWDFPDNAELQDLSRAIYHQGGYVTSVCHGIAGLLNLKDDDGEYLIAGKKVTGFTHSEEILAGKQGVVPFSNRRVAEAHGADWQQKRFYKEYAVQDGQLITGQNPFSVHAVANLLIKALN